MLKKFFIVFTFLCFVSGISACSPSGETGNNESKEKEEAVQTSIDYSEINNDKTIQFRLGDYELTEVNIDNETWSQINISGGVNTSEEGVAEVPFFKASLQIPQNTGFTFEITDESYTDYNLKSTLLPSRGTIYRNQNPDTIPYKYNSTRNTSEWYPGDRIETGAPFMFRQVKGGTVYIYPFQYLASENILRVYDSINIKIGEVLSTHIEENTVKNIMPGSVKNTCSDLFINYKDSVKATGMQDEMGDVLVIYTSRDKNAIQPWIQWKSEKGFKVHEKEVSTGSNVKSTIAAMYSNNPQLLYVQLVGDWDDIKSDTGTSQNAPMDPMLGCVSGNDNLPDLAVGRFSANSASEVSIQVNKVIEYEKNPGGSWYKTD